MFGLLGSLDHKLVTPALPVPRAADTMEIYAKRVAELLQVAAEDYIGGCSFGGLVASAIARRQRVAGLILIGGALSSETVAPLSRRLATISTRTPRFLMRALLKSRPFLTHVFGRLTQPQIALARDMLEQVPREMITRGTHLARSYFPSNLPACPIFALHGLQDRVMRPPAVPGCRILPNAGHGLAVTHAEETTLFLRETLRCTNQGRDN